MSLVACGGGGGDSASPTPPPTTPPPTTPPPTTPPPPAPPPAGSGLDARPSNTSCLAPDRPVSTLTLSVARVFNNLTFSRPIGMLQAPGQSDRWFVVQQDGVVRVFPNTASPTAANFVDIAARVASPSDNAGSETGLLGMAFHPNFPTDPRVFLSYTSNVSGLQSRISAFTAINNGQMLDPNSEDILMSVNQPESNHNGGHIAFGPDNMLYIGLGDGGSGGDPHGPIGNGQNRRTLLGKLLRIDINTVPSGQKYGIPSGNMFPETNARCGPTGGGADCPEIYAMGFRNPWRWNFDSRPGGTNQLWLADVGQNALEEVDLVVAGGNYGWRCEEGDRDFEPGNCGNETNLIPPVAQYGRTLGVSVTGGYVYRGAAIPALQGRYVFGDFATGNLWHIALDTTPTLNLTAAMAFASNRQIASFGQGNDGELYIVDYAGGLYRLEAAGGGGGTIPTQLSATDCVNASDPKQPASGLIPFAPNAPFWSDGADKDRWVALPDGTTMTVQGSGDWDFPNRTVLMKNFRVGTRLIETRLFMKHPDGEWAGYTYEWNDAQTDATRVVGGKEAPKTGLPNDWIFPSEAECLTCHTAAAGRSLGIETAQLNGDFPYPAPGRTANQLVTHSGIGTVTPAITQDPATLPALANPASGTATLNDRARAYLHTNCSQCHRPNGGTPVNLDFRFTTALAATNACDVAPANSLGIANARIIAPGDAGRSVVANRMNRRDANQMPNLGSNTVDAEGVTLITNWINALTSCN